MQSKLTLCYTVRALKAVASKYECAVAAVVLATPWLMIMQHTVMHSMYLNGICCLGQLV